MDMGERRRAIQQHLAAHRERVAEVLGVKDQQPLSLSFKTSQQSDPAKVQSWLESLPEGASTLEGWAKQYEAELQNRGDAPS